MKFFLKTILNCIFVLMSYPSFAQLTVKSNFNREEGQLNIELINKSPYILFFLSETLSYPPHITIKSFDSEENAIEWLRRPPSEHNGPYLFNEMYFILKQNESYLLSYDIKPDNKKKKPEYFIVTYNLTALLLDVENIENDKLIKERSKYRKGSMSLHFKERFEFEKGKCNNKLVND